MLESLRNVDWTKWGPLTVVVVALTLIAAVFVAIYLIVARPSTAAIIGFLKAMGEFAGATGLIGVAHAILGHGEATSTVQDPEVRKASANVEDATEFLGGIPRLESAIRPDEHVTEPVPDEPPPPPTTGTMPPSAPTPGL